MEWAISWLKQDKKAIETILETQKKEFDYKILEKERSTREELLELRKIQNSIEKEAPGLKQKMDTYRTELANVLVSEEAYLEMWTKPEEKRNLKEFVQVWVYEVVKKYKDELEKVRRQNEVLRESEMIASEKYNRENKEMTTLSSIM